MNVIDGVVRARIARNQSGHQRLFAMNIESEFVEYGLLRCVSDMNCSSFPIGIIENSFQI